MDIIHSLATYNVHSIVATVTAESGEVLNCTVCVFTSLAKEVMVLVALVSLSVCLFVCGQHYSKSYERIGMKFYGRVLSGTRKN